MGFPAALTIDEGPEGEPVFLRIARAVVREVRRGRLRPGDALPGTRALAASLGVHRNTVLAAWAELSAEGWIETVPARGTFVTRALPDHLPKRFGRAPSREGVPERAGFELPPPGPSIAPHVAVPKGVLALYGGVPDLAMLPRDALARAWRRALKQGGPSLLGYADARGDARLRAALASILTALRGLAVGADDLMVTRGSQMALSLAAKTLLRPGDVVAVESYGYRPAWEALRAEGARLVAVRVDRDGVDVDALAALMEREPVREVYVTPHHQYPTTAVLSPGRRMALLALARARRVAVIEDDYDHEFHYEGRPVLPLASADDAGVVVYVGTLSKLLAPALRVGFVSAPRAVLDRMAEARALIDRQGDPVTERAVAALLEEGEVERHAKRARRAYQSRRDAMVEALTRELGGALSFRVPMGGMALWERVKAVEVEAWAARCEAAGVWLHTGRRFSFDGRPRPYLRLGYASLSERSIAEAARRMARCLE
ncbi:MAG: PLP-dependent aminotransferase family protein [Polyangiales bacterium]